eukprot:1114407-Alexandrium_andersonii.AAC.1
MIRDCQSRLHRWGSANRVTFDTGKESAHVLSRRASGPSFKMLGVVFDPQLLMHEAVHSCVVDC